MIDNSLFYNMIGITVMLRFCIFEIIFGTYQ